MPGGPPWFLSVILPENGTSQAEHRAPLLLVAKSSQVQIHPSLGEPDALVGVCVAPHSPEEGKRCFKMLIAADTNELYYFDQARYRGPEDAAFGDSEIKKFGRRNGIVTA